MTRSPVSLTIADAFTDEPFGGNPAAVCLLERPSDEAWMQAMAAELDFPMTAFLHPVGAGEYGLRWFTAEVEIDLCGHATLASAHTLGGDAVFHTKSGTLSCRRADDGAIEMDFPAIPVTEMKDRSPVEAALRAPVVGAWDDGHWWLVEVASPAEVRAAEPDMDALRAFGGIMVVVAAPGETPGTDSACRVFEPASGLPEDPVTGSAHCVIAPWLAARTGQTAFKSEQLSARGGRIEMRLNGDDRVVLRGRAVTIAEGALCIEPA